MEEIKVGEYIRTIDGYIRKVIQYNEKGSHRCICFGACETDKDYKNSKGISLKKIKKHSPNIIDLIEKNDFVNSKRVTSVDTKKNKVYVEEMYYFNKKDIKSIVTHELFEKMEYEI